MYQPGASFAHLQCKLLVQHTACTWRTLLICAGQHPSQKKRAVQRADWEAPGGDWRQQVLWSAHGVRHLHWLLFQACVDSPQTWKSPMVKPTFLFWSCCLGVVFLKAKAVYCFGGISCLSSVLVPMPFWQKWFQASGQRGGMWLDMAWSALGSFNAKLKTFLFSQYFCLNYDQYSVSATVVCMRLHIEISVKCLNSLHFYGFFPYNTLCKLLW